MKPGRLTGAGGSIPAHDSGTYRPNDATAMIGGSQKVATKGRSKVMMSNAEARAAQLT